MLNNISALELLAHVAWLVPLATFVAWCWLRDDVGQRRRFAAIAGGLLLAQVTAGVLMGYLDPNTTMLGAALVISSTSWLQLPLLAGCFGPDRAMPGIALGVVTPLLGGIMGLFVAIGTGVINPCG